MFAFGYAVSRDPKVRSITTQRVFQRCAVIIADFTEDELKFAVSMAERRNQELHSGVSPFDGLSPDLWQAEFYRVCEVLLTFLEKGLTDLLGADDATAAATMVVQTGEQKKHDVLKRVGAKRDWFEALTEAEREMRLNEGAEE